MTPKQIEKQFKYAARHKLTPLDFCKMLAAPPHDLTPAEATALMDRYKQAYPELASFGNQINQIVKRDGKQMNRKYAEVVKANPVPMAGLLNGKPFRPPHENLVSVVVRELDPEPTLDGMGLVPLKRASVLNRSAVKAYALEVSKAKRAGKFNRVSKPFVDAVEAQLENIIRELCQFETELPESDLVMVNFSALMKRSRDQWSKAVKAIIYSKVMSHPSLGKTLK